uniref:Putative conserved secreted protein fat body overexpressed n=1 Tax=Rhipicephalus microplus TaxID=6941 RepID=A0A6M2CX52_RHIMP
MKLMVTLIAFAIVGVLLHNSSAAPAGHLSGESSEEAQRTVRYNDDAVARVSVACVNNICTVSQLKK